MVNPVENPPPLAGFDHRCRPWYQNAITYKAEDRVYMGQPYIFYQNPIVGISPTHYFKLEGKDGQTEPYEGVMGFDLTRSLFTDEMSELAMNYEKFFLVEANSQLVAISFTGNETLDPEDPTRVVSVENYLIEGSRDDPTIA